MRTHPPRLTTHPQTSGEEVNTLAKSGTLVVAGAPPSLEVDGHKVPIVASAKAPFTRVGRDFK